MTINLPLPHSSKHIIYLNDSLLDLQKILLFIDDTDSIRFSLTNIT